MQWTTGGRSGSYNGLYGTAALAGINAGDGRTFVTIPGSLTSRIINIPRTSNVGIPGIWMFKVDLSMHKCNCIIYLYVCNNKLQILQTRLQVISQCWLFRKLLSPFNGIF